VPVGVGNGGWCVIGAAAFAMLTRASLDRRRAWERIAPAGALPPGPVITCMACNLAAPASCEGAACSRCGGRLWRRKPCSVMRTTALVATGYLLYPAANYFPMTVGLQLGAEDDHTIYAGVRQLVEAHLWPLAIVIFTASIGIPLLKLAGLTWCIASVRSGSRRALVAKTRLYRFVEAVGRWSNIDVYTIAVFLPLFQFGEMASVHASVGDAAFLAVVVATMVAARTFDPRLMWDAAEGAP